MHINQILGFVLMFSFVADHFMWDTWVKAMREKTGQKVVTKDPTYTFTTTIMLISGIILSLGLMKSDAIYGTTWAGSLLRLMGIALGFFGLYMFHQAHVHLAENWMPTVSKLQDQKLVTTGPYQILRHPMYTGVALATIGYFILFGASFWAWPQLLSMLVLVSYRVPTEDKMMANMFKERHSEWTKKTYKMIPYVW